MGLMMEMGGAAVAVVEGVAAVAMVAVDGAGGTMGAKAPGMVEVAVGMEVMTKPGADKVGATGTEAASGEGEMTGMGAESDWEAGGGDGSGLWGFGSRASSSFCSEARTSWGV